MIDNVVDDILKAQAFRLKGRLYALTVMHIISSDCEFLLHQLRESARNAPRLFDRTPLILDCSALIGNSFDLALLCRYLRDYSLIPLAVQGADAEMASLAQTLGLAVINATLSHAKHAANLSLRSKL